MTPNDPRPNDPRRDTPAADQRVADQNVEHLIKTAYKPETPDPEFVRRTTAAMLAAAARQAAAPVAGRRLGVGERLAVFAVVASLLIGIGVILGSAMLGTSDVQAPNQLVDTVPAVPEPRSFRVSNTSGAQPVAYTGLVARPRTETAPLDPVETGDVLTTTAGQRRRVALQDGSVLYLNGETEVQIDRARHVTLRRGEVFVEVSPRTAPESRFVVSTPGRDVTALGTKFNVRLDDEGTAVAVTQGKVRVSGFELPILAGQQLAPEAAATVTPAPRTTHLLAWTRDLMAAAESPLVPRSKHAGGSLVAVDPHGQEAKLSLRKYHVDVHIEDGFARTTIDQTYFNHLNSRLEGTFYFPLPPDASLSRLAMYVGEKLMEGGMAERGHARQVFEDIVRKAKDPALLEWIDGSTFKMRVFPLEGRQEKRIVISYTQKLPSLYRETNYRFPGGHNMQKVGKWSARLRVKDGRRLRWESGSHDFAATKEKGDLILEASAEKTTPDQDVTLSLRRKRKRGLSPFGTRKAGSGGIEGTVPFSEHGQTRFSSTKHEGSTYLMARWRPDLPSPKRHERRDWIFLFESSADRDPLLARVQVDVVKTLLENGEHEDTFSVVAAGTRVHRLGTKPQAATVENVRQTVEKLERQHLVGALDLGRAIDAVKPLVEKAENPVLVHLGSGVPVLGEKDIDALVRRLPKRARYVGVGVGKRWSRTLMKTAANRTGGYYTQINPDEQINWRALDLLATLNTSRLLDVKVTDAAEQLTLLCHDEMLAGGEELCAIARLDGDDRMPESIVVTGRLDGESYRKELDVENIAEGAGYLPRIWAKLEIDRLTALGAVENKGRIIELSKAMYVMSPFTSLLVLENEEMYAQYNVDRGRKDHWALYPCPERIEVVHEPLKYVANADEGGAAKKKSVADVLGTMVLGRPRWVSPRRAPLTLRQYRNFYNGQQVHSTNGNTTNINGGFGGMSGGGMPMGMGFGMGGMGGFGMGGGMMGGMGGFGGGMRGAVHFPTFSFVPVTTTVSVPDGATVLLGGIRRLTAGSGTFNTAGVQLGNIDTNGAEITGYMISSESGALTASATRFYPVADLLMPITNESFSMGTIGRETQGLRMMVTPRIIIQEEDEERLGIDFNRPYQVFGRIIPDDDLEFNTTGIDYNRSVTLGMQSPGVFSAELDIPFRRDDFGLIVPQFGGYESREERHKGFLSSVDEAGVAFSDEPPIVFPSAEAWRELTARRREKHARHAFADGSVHSLLDTIDADLYRWLTRKNLQQHVSQRLASLGPEERKIVEALNSPTSLTFDETPFMDVVEYLEDYHKIEIEIDARVLGDSEVSTDPVVTCNHEDLPLGVALREILRPLKLTYLVEDGVLLFTSVEEIETRRIAWYCSAVARRHINNDTYGRELKYQLPTFDNPGHIYHDLLGYAPGMRTSRADVLAVLEAEVPSESPPKTGLVDARARRLIETARGAGWRTATFRDDEGDLLLSVDFDGTGRCRYERTTARGLKETVVCDGANLWQLYPELGLGARRGFSRFHRRDLARLIPWVLPPIETLTRGADLETVDPRTVAVLPHGIEELKDKDGKTPEHVLLHLVFSENGRLAQRRLVEMPSKKILLRQMLAADGSIRWLDGEDKELAKREIDLKRCGAPDLKPDARRLVILPMPIRWQGHVSDIGCENWSEEEALKNIATALAIDPWTATRIIVRRFFQRDDRRLGFYVTMVAAGHRWNPKEERDIDGVRLKCDPAADHPDEPAARYLSAYLRIQAEGKGEFGPIGGSEDGLPAQLAEFHDLWKTFESDRADSERHKQWCDRTVAFIRRCNSPELGFALLTKLCDQAGNQESRRAVAEAAKALSRVPGLAYFARYERARAERKSGNAGLAQKLFEKLFRDALQAGFLPPIDGDFRRGLRSGSDAEKKWAAVMRKAADELLEKNARATVIRLAWQAHRLGSADLATELFDRAYDNVTHDDSLPLTLVAVEYLWHTGQRTRADLMLESLLRNERRAKWPGLWRLAATMAEKQGMTARALAHTQRAMDLEYEHLGETVDVRAVRQGHGELLDRYGQLAKAVATLQSEPPQEFVARVVRLADRWRSLDTDPTAACHAAAKVLADLGAAELAWDYLTTPLAAKPNEAAPWRDLAGMLRQQAQFDLADRAYALAFEAEPQNAQILWDRAQVLLESGRRDDAEKLFGRIADGPWQEEFSELKTRARKRLQNSP